ncbi:MAG: thioredoxin family protein [Candidatus Omnitrophica bacterium]|nr:thioredoxin family protein [Candidatus Omnitrophota bacterium]
MAPAQSADPFANWLDGAEGFERAMDRRRGTSDAVLLYFYTDWCPHCRRFDQQVAASREVGEYVRHAIAVRINPEHGTREKALAERHGVTGYPTLLVLPPGMEQTQNVTAYRGSPQEFVEACEAAGSKRAVKKSLSAAQPTSSVATRPKPAPNPPPQKAQATPKPPASPAKNTVYLKNGNVMEGTVQAVNEQGFVLEVEGIGRLTLSRAEVVSVDGPLPGK